MDWKLSGVLRNRANETIEVYLLHWDEKGRLCTDRRWEDRICS